jgi:hypothetical protein
MTSAPLPGTARPPAKSGGGLTTAERPDSPMPMTLPDIPPPPAPASFKLPEFPWPPPKASTSYVLPDDLLKNDHRIGDAEHAIEAALERTGYVERAFFRTPDGIAMVTRLERIQADGTPIGDPRWAISPSTYELQVGLMTFLRGLFFVPPGHYRLIVFIIQNSPFNQSEDKLSKDEARKMMSKGANVLPADIAQQPFTGHCTVLIYEFDNDGKAVHLVESRLTGKQHLEKAGLLTALGAPN